MKIPNLFFPILIITFCAAFAGGYFFNSMLSPHTSPELARDTETIPFGTHRMPDGTFMPHDSMMMDHGSMIVTSERSFLEGMIPHHQEAVDTAKEVLERGGTTPEIRSLAEAIITAQEIEIASMKQWYEAWYQEPYQATGKYEPMMRDLSTLSGRALDQTFLEDMIVHHMGAIMMAQSVQPYIEHQEVADLRTAIIETQSVEMRLMQNLLQDL